ncbi:MAG TPA: hypothetical protein VK963_04650 [Candidatus Saccharimonadales bacterium]|nr:hypothetical protein [Candidatus Saccharimonadales bacterium]
MELSPDQAEPAFDQSEFDQTEPSFQPDQLLADQSQSAYRDIYDRAVNILSRYPRVEQITGQEFIGFPAKAVLVNTVRITQGEAGSVELRATTAAARPAFEWRLEITLDNKITESYKHYLLRDNDEIVEAYGRQVNPATAAEAQELAAELERLRDELEEAKVLIEPGRNQFAL